MILHNMFAVAKLVLPPSGPASKIDCQNLLLRYKCIKIDKFIYKVNKKFKTYSSGGTPLKIENLYRSHSLT